MGDEGGITNLMRNHAGFRHGVIMFNGVLTSEIIGNQFEMPWKPLELLISVY